MMHPGRNRAMLLKKRNKLLHALFVSHILNKETYELSLLEPIPDVPVPFSDLVPHLTSSFQQGNTQYAVHTSIQSTMQENVIRIVNDYYTQLTINHIRNLSVVILDVHSGKTLVYVGNVPVTSGKAEDQQVDCAAAPRSTGSTQSFLFMGIQQDGILLPVP